MARLPGVLKRKNEDADLAQRLRAENLARLRAGQGAAAPAAAGAARAAVGAAGARV